MYSTHLESTFQTLINGLPQGIMIVPQDEGKPIVNAEFIRMWDFSEEIIALEDGDAYLTFISSKLPAGSDLFPTEVSTLEEQPGGISHLFELQNRIIQFSHRPLWNGSKKWGAAYLFEELTAKIKTEQSFRKQISAENIIRGLTASLKPTLDFQVLITQTIAELGTFLKLDRLVIWKLAVDESYRLQQVINVGCFTQDHAPLNRGELGEYEAYFKNHPPLLRYYGNGSHHQFSDLEQANLNHSYKTVFERTGVKSAIAMPIIINDQLRGLTMFHGCGEVRAWQDWHQQLLRDFHQQVQVLWQYQELAEECKGLKEEIQKNAVVDELTMIPNLRRFEQVLEQEWQRLARDNMPIALIMCDVDYFNLYNDFYGHDQGDTCLQQIAWALSLLMKRPADFVSRFGGEEFAILLPNTDLQGGLTMAQQIQEKIKDLAIEHSRSPIGKYITVSLGVSSINTTLEVLPEVLINQARKAMIQAKVQGGDRYTMAEII